MTRTVWLCTSAVLFLTAEAVGQSTTGQAQSAGPSAQAMELCRRMSSTELQIACLEAALDAAYRNPPPSALAQSAPAERPGSSGQTLLSRLNPFGAGSETDRDGAPSAGGDAMVTASGPSGLGAEQVTRRDRAWADDTASSRATLSARIVAADIHGYASLVFALDNGQVWRQLSADTQRIDAEDVIGGNVVLREASISGYQAVLGDIGRTIRVERLR